MAKVRNVLILCTGNSARSILGEVLFNAPAIGGGRFRGYSAGSQPKGQVNPFALEQLRRSGLPTDGLRSKSWDEFAVAGAPVMDFIFTVCDSAVGETCPLWPGQPVSAHWGLPDPAAVVGTDEAKRRAFIQAYAVLRKRIEGFVALPLHDLSGAELHDRLRTLGRLAG